MGGGETLRGEGGGGGQRTGGICKESGRRVLGEGTETKEREIERTDRGV